MQSWSDGPNPPYQHSTAPALHNSNSYSPKTLRSEVHRRGRLPIEECLQLALSLTSALAQLHQKGLIHRDIKPSNIIFADGMPKLADIGLVASVTEARSFVGTEGFIPPEGPGAPQADLYSLGKVLYEISTGKDRTDFPELPTELRELTGKEQLLEFNEVVLKACQSNPVKRYQSAEEMHADVALLQSGKSVKHLRLMEHRMSLVTRVGALALVLALLGAGAFWYQKVQTRRALEISQNELKLRQAAERERLRAVTAEKAERDLRQRAEAEERKTATEGKLVMKFVEEVFRVASSSDSTLLRGVLDGAADRLKKSPDTTAEVEAGTRHVISYFYGLVREHQKAETMAREALIISRKLGDDKEIAESLGLLAIALDAQKKWAEAESLYREALEINRKLRDEKGVAELLKRWADSLQGQKKLVEAEAIYREALASQRQLGDHDGIADSLNDLGDLLLEQKKFVEAEDVFRQALALMRTLNDEHALASVLDKLHSALHGQKKLIEAEIPLRESMVLYRKLNATNEVVSRRSHLVDSLRREGKYAEAEQFFKDELKEANQDQSQVVSLLRDRADFFARRGQWKIAAADAIKALEFKPKDHVPYHMLAPLLVADGDVESYRQLCQKILAKFSGSNDPFIADRMAKDSLILAPSGADLAVVAQLADTAVTAGKSQSALPYFQFSKGLAEYRQSNFTSAVEWMHKSIEKRSFPNDTNRFVEAYMVLAMAEHQLKHADEARAAFDKGTQMADQLKKLESGDIGSGWRDWIIAHALMKEANALIEGQTAAEADKRKQQ